MKKLIYILSFLSLPLCYFSQQNVEFEKKNLAKKYNTAIRIEFYSKGISNVFLDEIRVYDNLNMHDIKIYPIPTTKREITANINQDEQEEMIFEIVNFLGKSMRTWQVSKEKEKETINLIDMAAGLYFLRTTFLPSQQMQIRKFYIEQ